MPNGLHKWLYNASWLNGHFQKGTDTILIKTPIDEESKLRGETSEEKGRFGSGFYREIAICYRFGYRLERNSQNQILMKHSNPENLKQIALEELLTCFDSEESIKDMEVYYNQAMETYQQLALETDETLSPSEEGPQTSPALSSNELALAAGLGAITESLEQQSQTGENITESEHQVAGVPETARRLTPQADSVTSREQKTTEEEPVPKRQKTESSKPPSPK